MILLLIPFILFAQDFHFILKGVPFEIQIDREHVIRMRLISPELEYKAIDFTPKLQNSFRKIFIVKPTYLDFTLNFNESDGEDIPSPLEYPEQFSDLVPFKYFDGETGIRIGNKFLDENGREFVFVEVGNKKLVFYKSLSQFSWRLLPAVNINIRMLPVYDKAGGEQIIVANNILIDALKESRSTHRRVRMDEIMLMVRVNDGFSSYRQYSRGPEYISKGLFNIFKIVKDVKVKLPTPCGIHWVARPEEIEFLDESFAPNFYRPIKYEEELSVIYGKLIVRSYYSNNKELVYKLAEDEHGRIFFTSAYKPGKVTQNGLSSDIINGESLFSPLFEYNAQIPFGYAGRTNHVDRLYSDQWEYIKNIPIIQKWYEIHKREIP